MLSSDNVTGTYLQMFTAASHHSTTDLVCSFECSPQTCFFQEFTYLRNRLDWLLYDQYTMMMMWVLVNRVDSELKTA